MITHRGGRPSSPQQETPSASTRAGGNGKPINTFRTTLLLMTSLISIVGLFLLIQYSIQSKTATVVKRSDWIDPRSVANIADLPDVTHEAFFDIEIDSEYIGRVIIGLFGGTVPMTVQNFYQICSGENGPHLHYKGMRFHRIIPGFIVQGGDIVNGDGTGGTTIYGTRYFNDEPEGLKWAHDRPYLLQMANAGPNTNGCQFCFMLNPAPHLNGKHVVFGVVLSGFHIVDQMGLAGDKFEKPTKSVVVVDSGVVLPPQSD